MLSEKTLQRLIASWNKQFGLRVPAGDLEYWVRHLRQAGLTDENASRLFFGFCQARLPGRPPSFNDLWLHVRGERQREKAEEHQRRKMGKDGVPSAEALRIVRRMMQRLGVRRADLADEAAVQADIEAERRRQLDMLRRQEGR